ncbi:uncharacterized protein Dana_GF18717 [Drosophila ananassae]|uniref:BTB domain-containing protein n=1 Tax=Drosophila ananassae TaxID=7217 RepID=B3LXL9_DROAN|nr:uncharacterized protein LOC6501487 [Drosophila ananassae]EDV43913.1 uncharacterized protein Dana_GF18717 [Drosophila ananassae]
MSDTWDEDEAERGSPDRPRQNLQAEEKTSPNNGQESKRSSTGSTGLKIASQGVPSKRATLDESFNRSSDSFNQWSSDASARPNSKDRRLEYFRKGTNTDCEVHVLSTCVENEDIVGNVCYKKFACHRIFLATASDKLEQDVYRNKQWNGVLQINGVSPESVEIFLEFIYTFQVSPAMVQLGLVGDIFILSCAYNIPELLRTYSSRLKDTEWPIDGIFPTFDLAFRHNIIDLEHVCMGKIIEHADELTKEPGLMKLQVYALNFVIQHWILTDVVAQRDLVHLLQEYQEMNEITFSNSQKFPHFTKIIKYFPNVLLDSEGYIKKF